MQQLAYKTFRNNIFPFIVALSFYCHNICIVVGYKDAMFIV